MMIESWAGTGGQNCRLGRHRWSVSRLIDLAKELPVMDVPIDHLCVNYDYSHLTLRKMAMHIKAVLAADMSCPIILDEDGELMDGRHRLMRAMIEGHETIKVVRFQENPSPCEVIEG